MKQIESYRSFNGTQQIWQHQSQALQCEMKIAIYLPEQAQCARCPVVYWLSGLTCNERNFIEKSGFQRYANELGLIVVAPDTSPRGDDVANDEAYDLGQGAGFYINATEAPWDRHYHMYDYIVDELPKLIDAHLPTNGKQSICGHSMGGHGALMIALKNPENYCSVSAFAPIVAPTQVPWGQKAFGAYLGQDQNTWQAWDSTALLGLTSKVIPMRIEQGMSDNFLQEQLKTELFETVAAQKSVSVTINRREGYDHSYYFIASFIGEHLRFHADALRGQ